MSKREGVTRYKRLLNNTKKPPSGDTGLDELRIKMKEHAKKMRAGGKKAAGTRTAGKKERSH